MDDLNTFCEGLFFYLDIFSLPSSLSGVRKLVLGGPYESLILGVMKWDFKGTNHKWRPYSYKNQDLGLSVKLYQGF